LIFSNNELGIDVGASGPTYDDPAYQNFPVLTSAIISGSQITITGTVTSRPNLTLLLEFFDNPEADPSGYGEGQDFLGSIEVTTDSSGNASFAVSFGITTDFTGTFVSATATDPVRGTSEFSADVPVTGPSGNRPPLATDDSATTDEDTVLLVPAPGLLLNDTDPDGDPLFVHEDAFFTALGAEVAIAADGGYIYDPTVSALFNALPEGDSVEDSFTYTVDDGQGNTASATVRITVHGRNDPPTANDDTVQGEPTSLVIPASMLLVNDTDPDSDSLHIVSVELSGGTTGPTLTLASLGGGTDASVSLEDNGTPEDFSDDYVLFTSPGDFTSPVTFTYTISDPFGATSTAFVTVLPPESLIATTTTLAASPNPSVYGQAVTFDVTVSNVSSGDPPTGTVTLTDSLQGTLTTLTLGDGGPPIPVLIAGTHIIVASYSGDDLHAASESAPLTVIVNPDSTTTTVLSSAPVQKFGQPVSFAANIIDDPPGSGSPTGGTVTFYDTYNGVTSVLAVVSATNAVTPFFTNLGMGQHEIVAVFSGDSNLLGSTSAVFTQLIVDPPHPQPKNGKGHSQRSGDANLPALDAWYARGR
jgi:VCBS repeat-containing protein